MQPELKEYVVKMYDNNDMSNITTIKATSEKQAIDTALNIKECLVAKIVSILEIK